MSTAAHGSTEYGVPKRVRFANTRAAANKALTAGAENRFRFTERPDDVPGILPLVRCNVEFTLPGNGPSKLVERLHTPKPPRNANNEANFLQSLPTQIRPTWYWTDANDWYLSADRNDILAVEVGFPDGKQEPELPIQDDPRSGSVFSRDVITDKLALYDRLLGVDLKAAEEIVEDARKVVWMTDFSGAPMPDVAAVYARTERAVALALALGRYSLIEVEAIIGELRVAFDVNAFGRDPDSRFGAQFAAAATRKAVPASDLERSKERHPIERMFSKLRQMRRIATRYDKTRSSFESFIDPAATGCRQPLSTEHRPRAISHDITRGLIQSRSNHLSNRSKPSVCVHPSA